MSRIVISVDHGNSNIKTENHVFPASYVVSNHLPSLGADILVYHEKEYTLSDKRMPQLTDKTVDERYFILTLFAIAKELSDRDDYYSGATVDVVLLVGLPPLHCKEMGARFSTYFKEHGESVRFKFNNLLFSICITDVYVRPQAYAAVLTASDQLKGCNTINIVDIGGYTADLLQLVENKPNMSVCTSLYNGVNLLIQKINEPVRAKGKQDIPDNVIEGVLLKNEAVLTDCSDERIALIKNQSEQFTIELLHKIQQFGLDLSENTAVFIGGGSLLLREYRRVWHGFTTRIRGRCSRQCQRIQLNP